MTPADLRAIAARVMAGEATNKEIALALGWTQADYFGWWTPLSANPSNHLQRLPDYLHSLDAANLLMAPLRKRGWRTRFGEAIAGGWYAVANHKRLAGPPICFAPTGPRARTALALLCRAVEMEGEG